MEADGNSLGWDRVMVTVRLGRGGPWGQMGTIWVGIGSWSQLGEGMEGHGGRLGHR